MRSTSDTCPDRAPGVDAAARLAVAAERMGCLESENATLRASLAALQETVAKLTARVTELERQLGLNSGNSGKPPSSDGLKKPPRTQSLREPLGKQSGGQPGHPGETLRAVAEPDVIQDHYPIQCAACGAPLIPEAATDYSARQVFDLPGPQPLVVTEHRAHRCQCPQCGETTRATFPEGVTAPVQYGARMSGACAVRFQGFVGTVYRLIQTVAVNHLDETGFRIGGKTQGLHIAATRWLTFYRTAPKRGRRWEGLLGILVHDPWKPYYTLTGVLHALCHAHH